MRQFLCVTAILAAGCGRVGFDSAPAVSDGGLVDGSMRDGAWADAFVLPPECQGPTADEDGDGIPNVCDNCPSVSNPGQANALEEAAGAVSDEPGDACDPRPSLPGDTILYFEGFEGSALPANWQVESGTWTVGGGIASQLGDGQDLRLAYTGALSNSDFLLETEFEIGAYIAPNSSNAGATIRLTNDSGWVCGTWQSGDGLTGALKIWELKNGTAGSPVEMAIPTPQVGSTYTMRVAGQGMNISCSLDPASSLVRSEAAHPSGSIALRTNRAHASFKYALIYGLGGGL